jgi:hypothetical protein
LFFRLPMHMIEGFHSQHKCFFVSFFSQQQKKAITLFPTLLITYIVTWICIVLGFYSWSGPYNFILSLILYQLIFGC